jgi:hypothetical protein
MARRGSGWLVFAAVILGVAGIMRVFDAIWAFRYHGAIPDNLEGAIFGHSLKTYGWVWLIVGIIYIVSAFLVVNGSAIGKWIGITAAAVGAFSAIWWMPYYPVWSLVYIGLGIMVMYALSTYGGEQAA